MKRPLVLLLVILIVSCSSSKKINNDGASRILKTGDIMEMNSEEFLVQNNTWRLQTTEHFKFFFDKSVNKELQNEVIRAQEKNYSELSKLMGLNNVKLAPINFWLFKDKTQKERLTLTNSDAHAISTFPSVYYLPKNATGAQEVGHVMTQSVWGFIPKTSNYALVIDEGFNYYIDSKRFYKQSIKDKLKSSNQLQNFNVVSLINANNGNRSRGVQTGSHEVNESLVSGAFVEFMIQNFGVEKFSQLWQIATKNDAADSTIFKGIYGKDITELNKEFNSFLN